MKKIVLASTSPRRHELFKRLEVPFEIVASNYEEDMTLQMHPLQLAKHLSLGKATSVAGKHKGSVVVGVDTFVVLGKTLLGKPHTFKRACEMLKKLSGKKHQVVTGLAVLDTRTGKLVSKTEVTDVYFRKLDESEIKRYVRTTKPFDKAGSYAIQDRGALFVKKIVGDYYNIMGLPLHTLAASLKEVGVKLL